MAGEDRHRGSAYRDPRHLPPGDPGHSPAWPAAVGLTGGGRFTASADDSRDRGPGAHMDAGFNVK